jgi:hypothetical protein
MLTAANFPEFHPQGLRQPQPLIRYSSPKPCRAKRKSASMRSETADTVSNAGRESAQSPQGHAEDTRD